MERRSESTYSSRFEKLLPDMASLVEENPDKVFKVQVERIDGNAFGNIYVSGRRMGDTIQMQIDGVEPLALGAFFMAIAQDKGQVCPGGIYIINYAPNEVCLADFPKKRARPI